MKTNKMKKHLSKLLVVASLSSILIVFNQCVVQEYEEVGTADIEASAETNGNVLPGEPEVTDLPPVNIVDEDNDPTNPVAVVRVTTSVAVKDFEQTYETYQAVTGIDSSRSGNIRNEYTLINSQLANENDIKKFGVATNIANVKLAGRFCEDMFASATYYNGLVSFNITSSPNAVLVGNLNNQKELVNALMGKFWGVGTQSAQELQGAETDLLELLNELLAEENAGSGAATRDVARGLCVAVLATPRVLML